MNGCHALTPTSEVTHGQIRRSNAGAKISQLTNHTNAVKKVKNAFVMVVGSFMVKN